jgi:Ser/Thr protein kinase RdoA (MazF antagonist)
LVDGQSLRVIDFDDCGFGWFMYAFAAWVASHAETLTAHTMGAAYTAGAVTLADRFLTLR